MVNAADRNVKAFISLENISIILGIKKFTRKHERL